MSRPQSLVSPGRTRVGGEPCGRARAVGLTVDNTVDTIHPFPPFSETFKHACQAFRRTTETMSCCVEYHPSTPSVHDTQI